MYRLLIRRKLFMLGLFPISADCENILDTNEKTENAVQKQENETGWDRVKKVFKLDKETGRPTQELNFIYNHIVAGSLIGIAFGGYINTRYAVQDFVDRHTASRFLSQADAKRRVRDHVIMKFAKGARIWCPKFAAFSTIYGASTVLLHVYMGEVKVSNFVIGGMLAGALLKVDTGIRGIVAGSIASGILTGAANSVILLMMRLTGISFQDLMNPPKSQFDSVPEICDDADVIHKGEENGQYKL